VPGIVVVEVLLVVVVVVPVVPHRTQHTERAWTELCWSDYWLDL